MIYIQGRPGDDGVRGEPGPVGHKVRFHVNIVPPDTIKTYNIIVIITMYVLI